MPVETMIEKATNAVAAGAVVSPWWLPSLSDVSNFAGLMLPVAGLVWLIIQIVYKIKNERDR